MPKLKYIAILFLITRIINLTLLPIFIDEANYLDWGWRETHTPHFLFYSLYDAKPPGLMWLFGLTQNFFSNPLFAGRLVVVLFGLLTFIGLYKISRTTGILYLTSPLFYFFDRQALMETPLSAVGVWSYYFMSRYLQSLKFKYLFFLGLTLGFGLLIKTNAVLFIVAAGMILVIRAARSRSLAPITSGVFLLMIILAVSSPLLFQPQFWSTLTKNSLYSFSVWEILHFPLLSWLNNSWVYLQMSFWHLTPLVFLASVFGLRKNHPVLQLWIFVPLSLLILSSRSPVLRYLVPFLPLLLIPAAEFIFRFRIYAIFSFITCLLLIGILAVSPPAYFRFMNFFTPYSQIGEYLTGPNTGYLVNADLDYLHTLKPPVLIGLAVNSGNPEAAIIDYLNHWPGYIPVYLDATLFGQNLNTADCLSSDPPIYFLARQNQTAGLDKFLTPVTAIHASYTTDFHTIYALKTGCPAGKTLLLNLTSTY